MNNFRRFHERKQYKDIQIVSRRLTQDLWFIHPQTIDSFFPTSRII